MKTSRGISGQFEDESRVVRGVLYSNLCMFNQMELQWNMPQHVIQKENAKWEVWMVLYEDNLNG